MKLAAQPGDRPPMTAEKRHMPFTLSVKASDDGRKVITFRGTTPTKDRYGDIVEPSGVILDAYRRNPVFLLAHEYGHSVPQLLPIGKSLKETVSDDGIDFEIEFDSEDDLAMQVYGKYKRAFMFGVSIGFIPREWEPMEDGRGWRITKWELLELSAVTIPANPDALIAASFGGARLLELDRSKEYLVTLPDEAPPAEAERIRDALAERGVEATVLIGVNVATLPNNQSGQDRPGPAVSGTVTPDPDLVLVDQLKSVLGVDTDDALFAVLADLATAPSVPPVTAHDIAKLAAQAIKDRLDYMNGKVA